FLLVSLANNTEKPLHAAARYQPCLATRLNPAQALGLGGEERVRPCFSGVQRSKPREEIGKRFLALAAAALADRQAAGALPVAEDDREGDLLELGLADPLADRLGGLADVGAVALGAQPVDDRGGRLEVALPHRQDADLHGREPERKRAGVVLGED